MKDSFGRDIDYLRVSVTDRCNLRCVYCMPEEGVKPLSHQDILTYEEIIQLVEVARSLGVRHVRITGGEPLVRKDLVYLIRGIKELGIEDLSMTTNGTLLSSLALDLKKAGLDRVNISLDTLDPVKFRGITRRGNLQDVLDGIRSAIDAGLNPVKINTVVMASLNLDQVIELARLSIKYPVHVRFIEVMPVGPDDLLAQKDYVPLKDIVNQVSKLGPLQPVNVTGAGPAQSVKLPGAQGSIGFIGALSHPFCSRCNRLRLTADGKLRPCLMSDGEVDVKAVLRSAQNGDKSKDISRPLPSSFLTGSKKSSLEALFKKAVLMKAKNYSTAVEHEKTRRMCQIGG